MPVSPYKQTIVRLRTDHHDALRAIAGQLDVPIAQCIRQAIREYITRTTFAPDRSPSVEHPKELRPQKRDEFGNPDPMPEGRAGLVRLPKPDVQPIFRGKDKL